MKQILAVDDCAVFQDVQRHTCIRIKCSKAGVTYIPMDTMLDVKTLSHKEFEQMYVIHLKDYPVKRAASSYLSAAWIQVTAQARRHLEFLAGKSFTDAVSTLNFENKESIMTEAAKAEKVKKVAAPKAAPKKAEKAVKEPAKKVAAPAKEAKTGSVGRTGVSKEAGKKISVLNKNPVVREGSNRAAVMKVLLGCKNTDDAAAKMREFTDKPWDVIRDAVLKEIIQLS
jgi:hypothetical protein